MTAFNSIGMAWQALTPRGGQRKYAYLCGSSSEVIACLYTVPLNSEKKGTLRHIEVDDQEASDWLDSAENRRRIRKSAANIRKQLPEISESDLRKKLLGTARAYIRHSKAVERGEITEIAAESAETKLRRILDDEDLEAEDVADLDRSDLRRKLAQTGKAVTRSQVRKAKKLQVALKDSVEYPGDLVFSEEKLDFGGMGSLDDVITALEGARDNGSNPAQAIRLIKQARTLVNLTRTSRDNYVKNVVPMMRKILSFLSQRPVPKTKAKKKRKKKKTDADYSEEQFLNDVLTDV
jgi:hypothetical protein